MTFDHVAEELAEQVTFVVTIGRNVGTVSMSDQRWGEFLSATSHLIFSIASCLYGSGNTFGEYGGELEEGYAWIGTMTGHRVRLLRPQLAYLATEYGQQAIGLIVQPNTDTLVFAD